MRSRIEPMKKIARSLRQHRQLILNYFRAHKLLSSGVVEGLNNKAKVIMRNLTNQHAVECDQHRSGVWTGNSRCAAIPLLTF
jgi:hypothetical protein